MERSDGPYESGHVILHRYLRPQPQKTHVSRLEKIPQVTPPVRQSYIYPHRLSITEKLHKLPLFSVYYTLAYQHILHPLCSVHHEFLVACHERVARRWPKEYKLALNLLQTASSGTLAVGGTGGTGGSGGRVTSAEKKQRQSGVLTLTEQPTQLVVTRTLRVPKCTLKLKKERYLLTTGCQAKYPVIPNPDAAKEQKKYDKAMKEYHTKLAGNVLLLLLLLLFRHMPSY